MTPEDEPLRERSSASRFNRASTPGASTPGAVDGDPFFSEFLSLSELPEFDALLPAGTSQADVPQRLSPEIETLLSEAAAHVRNLPTAPAALPEDDALLSQAQIDDLEALLARNAEERTEPPETAIAGSTVVLADALATVPPRTVRATFASPASHGAPASAPVTASSSLEHEEEPPLTTAHVDWRLATSSRWVAPPSVFDAEPHRVASLPPPAELEFTLSAGSPVEAIAQAIRSRASGALELESPDGTRLRHIVLRDGDIVTVASTVDDETLLHMLVERGDLSADLVGDRASRLPRGGRHAAAALIAQGFLGQDDLWTVLRAHAEWTLERALREGSLKAKLTTSTPERLRAEPSVFGGATGAEVFVDVVRRTIATDRALASLGGTTAALEEGPAASLLHEAARDATEVDAVTRAIGGNVSEVLEQIEDGATLVFALVALDILRVKTTSRESVLTSKPAEAALDATAVRERIRARLALVHDADYFALLGVCPDATSYDIRRAYAELRRDFEPSRLLTGETADLNADAHMILDVLTEAYEILRDDARRARYRRAIGSTAK